MDAGRRMAEHRVRSPARRRSTCVWLPRCFCARLGRARLASTTHITTA